MLTQSVWRTPPLWADSRCDKKGSESFRGLQQIQEFQGISLSIACYWILQVKFLPYCLYEGPSLDKSLNQLIQFKSQLKTSLLTLNAVILWCCVLLKEAIKSAKNSGVVQNPLHVVQFFPTTSQNVRNPFLVRVSAICVGLLAGRMKTRVKKKREYS